MDERRKKRKTVEDEPEEPAKRHGSTKKQKVGQPNDDLASLVESVRKKAKAKK
jgi:hypothetical protein